MLVACTVFFKMHCKHAFFRSNVFFLADCMENNINNSGGGDCVDDGGGGDDDGAGGSFHGASGDSDGDDSGGIEV